MPKTIIFESELPITLTSEDSGCALMVEDGQPVEVDGHPDFGMWIKITSWDESKAHTDIRELEGKRVRVTLEVLD